MKYLRSWGKRMKIMDEYESLENISVAFLNSIVSNQKKLNEVRRKQFQTMSKNASKINYNAIKTNNREILQKETEQISILIDEMDKILSKKLLMVDQDNVFAQKELEQEKIILHEIEKEMSESSANYAYLQTDQLRRSLVPTLLHLDLLCKKNQLNEKQKNHLQIVRKNIFSYIKNISIDTSELVIEDLLCEISNDEQKKAYFIIAHQLRTLFSPILNDVDMLLSTQIGTLNEKQTKTLESIKYNLNATNKIISELSESKDLV